MNKKLAMFMFALGLGVASAPAIARSCYYYCSVDWQACLQYGGTQAECDAALDACQLECRCGDPGTPECG